MDGLEGALEGELELGEGDGCGGGVGGGGDGELGGDEVADVDFGGGEGVGCSYCGAGGLADCVKKKDF